MAELMPPGVRPDLYRQFINAFISSMRALGIELSVEELPLQLGVFKSQTCIDASQVLLMLSSGGELVRLLSSHQLNLRRLLLPCQNFVLSRELSVSLVNAPRLRLEILHRGRFGKQHQSFPPPHGRQVASRDYQEAERHEHNRCKRRCCSPLPTSRALLLATRPSSSP